MQKCLGRHGTSSRNEATAKFLRNTCIVLLIKWNSSTPNRSPPFSSCAQERQSLYTGVQSMSLFVSHRKLTHPCALCTLSRGMVTSMSCTNANYFFSRRHFTFIQNSSKTLITQSFVFSSVIPSGKTKLCFKFLLGSNLLVQNTLSNFSSHTPGSIIQHLF